MAAGARLGLQPAAERTQVDLDREFRERLAETIDRGVDHLLCLQFAEGYWVGELEADTTLESDYILYLHLLGRPGDSRVAKLANYIRSRQLSDGGWNVYPGGPAELNATVKAYFALKLAGDSPEASHLLRARERVHQLGGLEATNSFTRFYLAMAGAVDWELVPAIPPELMLLPRWFYVNLYEMSSWTRGIVVPLTILYAHRPQWPAPACARLEELFRDPAQKTAAFAWGPGVFSWRNLFLAIDRALKLYERLPWKPFRRRALERARRWMFEHIERTDGLAGIFPAVMNSIFALVALGHPPEDPITARQMDQLERFEIEEDGTLRLQPCTSPVWDTAIAMVSLEEAGLRADHPALVRAARWLLDHQVLSPGDWQVKNRDAEPGGWVFEYRNDFYPDVDDTAFVLMALGRVDYPDRGRLESAIRRGLAWMVSMQNRDGGWGAFDRDNDRAALINIPFADHNAMIDPSTADVTARVLECLGQFGWPASHPVIQRGLQFLQRDQTPDAAWYGRWGVNYVYGTSGVLRALARFGLTARENCRRAVAWLISVQNPDGGFGESIESYNDPSRKGRGASTASQTAWGLIGLLAAAEENEAAVRRALDYLIEEQNRDGSWDEQEFTGTGFPCVFYLKYHLYRNSFPVYALARHHNLLCDAGQFAGVKLLPEQLERHNGA
jgi:squalene-hopene/tetraprenyl-beta-curcumene cyclase